MDYSKMSRSELLNAYIDKFKQNFPLYQSSGDSYELMRECLIKGEPYHVSDDKNRVY